MPKRATYILVFGRQERIERLLSEPTRLTFLRNPDNIGVRQVSRESDPSRFNNEPQRATYPTPSPSLSMSASSSSPYPQIQPSLPSALHQLSAPTPTLIDSQLSAYLIPSVLDALKSSSRAAVRRRREWERSEGLYSQEAKGKGKPDEAEEEEEEVKAALRSRIEAMGLMVGGTIAERSVSPFAIVQSSQALDYRCRSPLFPLTSTSSSSSAKIYSYTCMPEE